MSVTAKLQSRVIPTYPVGAPEKNPLFFEKRVYQGSNGKVYPVPFIDRVFDDPIPQSYQSAILANPYVQLEILPEIGGRIFTGQDRTNQNYDFFYRQDVIKPALVGLAGPWISGGVEFNWPQHHRPGTFMPCDVHIEHEDDGAKTIWLSEHDPLNRLKGMHGIRLRPDASTIELRARLYNRTPFTQSFLWWANVAAMVHDQYQSFFPPDVHYVADHAVRAMSSFPCANNPYYGVDYHHRPGKNDLSWYRNIPVPTSYMVCQTQFDFFGGYDHRAQGGFVHVANRDIAPGKKQWTWGNHPFGWAWDRELTDTNGPYVELMAGVYTDNQPDFSYLAPYETKTFSQFWYPIQAIGPVQQATLRAALHFSIRDDRTIQLGICVPEPLQNGKIILTANQRILATWPLSLLPGQSWSKRFTGWHGEHPEELELRILDSDQTCVLSYQPVNPSSQERLRELATEPPQPSEVPSADELYLTGEHLELYRHPTRAPEPYWLEALRRDPGDSRSHLALGRRLLKSGQFEPAASHLTAAIRRLTFRHPNPESGEAHYFLGLTRFFQHHFAAARTALAKATWNAAWRPPAHYLLACIDSRTGKIDQAIEHLEEAISCNGNHHHAQVLLAALLRRNDAIDEAATILDDLMEVDPLDHWARHEAMLCGTLSTEQFLTSCRNDAQTILDLAFDYADAGLTDEAAELIELHLAHPSPECAVPNPLRRSASCLYTLAWLRQDAKTLQSARNQSPDYFFPSRLHEVTVLQWAINQPGSDPLACYALGNALYDAKRHDEALAAWQQAIQAGAQFSTGYRNLGIALWNLQGDGEAATAAYQQAMQLNPNDARLVSEFDQLQAKRNIPPATRRAFLLDHLPLVLERDDASVALAALHNLLGDPAKALELLTSRRFHPWEGGEGSVLRQFTTAKLLLGQAALADGNPTQALNWFTSAMKTPESLGEAYHPLQAKADVNYWIGQAHKALNQPDEAQRAFEASATEAGDFSEMAVTAHSPLSRFRALSLRELGRTAEAEALLVDLRDFARQKLAEPATIDYFATSLPNLLVFEENLQTRRAADANLLLAIAHHGLGDTAAAREALAITLNFNQADPHAAALAALLEPLS